jgi:hypothetical protein
MQAVDKENKNRTKLNQKDQMKADDKETTKQN